MLNIDVLTLGCEFKDSDVNTWKVTSNFSETNKLLIEVSKVAEELIKEE